jgi:hypothetical protein
MIGKILTAILDALFAKHSSTEPREERRRHKRFNGRKRSDGLFIGGVTNEYLRIVREAQKEKK